jgi:hypothetical protein
VIRLRFGNNKKSTKMFRTENIFMVADTIIAPTSAEANQARIVFNGCWSDSCIDSGSVSKQEQKTLENLENMILCGLLGLFGWKIACALVSRPKTLPIPKAPTKHKQQNQLFPSMPPNILRSSSHLCTAPSAAFSSAARAHAEAVA